MKMTEQPGSKLQGQNLRIVRGIKGFLHGADRFLTNFCELFTFHGTPSHAAGMFP